MHLIVKYSLRFFTFNTFQSALGGGGGGSKTLPATPLTNFVAGMLAGVTEAILIVTPFEVVKIRLQAQLGLDKAQLKYRGPLHCAYTVARKEGITALWKGVGPTIVRNASNQACNFMSYDWIKRNLWFRDGRTELQPWQTIVTGAAAGAIGPLLNGPMDVVKTRLMRQERVPGQLPKYRNMIHAISVIVSQIARARVCIS
jgi:solute carrier family 25 citrate transporter 1